MCCVMCCISLKSACVILSAELCNRVSNLNRHLLVCAHHAYECMRHARHMCELHAYTCARRPYVHHTGFSNPATNSARDSSKALIRSFWFKIRPRRDIVRSAASLLLLWSLLCIHNNTSYQIAPRFSPHIATIKCISVLLCSSGM